MKSQAAGAVIRAVIILIVVSTPSLLIPGTSPETTQISTLVGLFAAFFTFTEYAGTYPGLIEFRDAPPFNRVRVISVFITLFALSIVASADSEMSTLALIIHAAGFVVGRALEFPYSPVSMVLDYVGQTSGEADRLRVLIMVGIASQVGLLTLAIFAILIRLHHWPHRDASFNVWVNLPTFDPTIGGDVVSRLIRDSRINILLGIMLPFLLPIMVRIGAKQLDVTVLNYPQTMVWAVTLWVFLPVTLFMRGLAMARIADMISARRKRLVARLEPEDGFAPA